VFWPVLYAKEFWFKLSRFAYGLLKSPPPLSLFFEASAVDRSPGKNHSCADWFRCIAIDKASEMVAPSPPFGP